MLEHLADACNFYGEAQGVRTFRKHLGWCLERASWDPSGEARQISAQLVREGATASFT